MNDILNEIDSSIDPIKRFSRKTAQGLESLSESSEAKMAKGHIRDVIKNSMNKNHLKLWMQVFQDYNQCNQFKIR